MFLLILAHPGCPGQNQESHKMVVFVCVRACVCVCALPINSITSVYVNGCIYFLMAINVQSEIIGKKYRLVH